MATLVKRIIISLPLRLYRDLKSVSAKEYKSIASIIRESITEKLSERFTRDELLLIQQGRKEFHSKKGKNWRTISRG